MKCVQCGRALSDAMIQAGNCPSCGAAVHAPTPAATTPPPAAVPPVSVAEPAATIPAASVAEPVAAVPPVSVAEPAAAVPPVSVAEPVAVTPAASVAEAPVAAAVSPVSVATESSGSTAPRPVVAAAAVASPVPVPTPVALTPPNAPERRSPLGALAVIAALVIILLLALLGFGKAGAGPLGGALGPAATPVPTTPPTATAPPPTATPLAGVPTPPAGFVSFVSPTSAYALSFPATWVSVAPPVSGAGVAGAEVFATLNQQDVFVVAQAQGQLTPDQYLPTLQNVLKTLPGVTNVQVSPTTTPVTVNGTVWTKLTGTFTYNGANDNATGLVTTHGGLTYVLLYFAPQTDFTTVESASFSVMVQSFTFLPGA